MKRHGKKLAGGLGLIFLLAAFCSVTVLAAGTDAPEPALYATVASLIPPVVAIVLALITKEVYSSLFIGILVGGLFYSECPHYSRQTAPQQIHPEKYG